MRHQERREASITPCIPARGERVVHRGAACQPATILSGSPRGRPRRCARDRPDPSAAPGRPPVGRGLIGNARSSATARSSPAPGAATRSPPSARRRVRSRRRGIVEIGHRRGGVGLFDVHLVQEPDSFSQRLVGRLELTHPCPQTSQFGLIAVLRGRLPPWPTLSVSPGEPSYHHLLAESGPGRDHRRTPPPPPPELAIRHPPSSQPRPLLPIRQQLILNDELTNLRRT